MKESEHQNRGRKEKDLNRGTTIRFVLGKYLGTPILQLDLYLFQTETVLLICLNRPVAEGRGKGGHEAREAALGQGLAVLRRTVPNTRTFTNMSGTDLD